MKQRSELPQILICSGLDPTGHAGILRDIEACQKHNKTYFAFVTSLTSQNDSEFFDIEQPSLSFYKKTWNALETKKLKAVKLGMLGTRSSINFLSKKISELKKKKPKIKIIWDPVIKSTSGGELLSYQNLNISLKKILPLVDVITPNAYEACLLLKQKFSKNKNGTQLCTDLFKKYKKPIYLKGGHLLKKSSDFLTDGSPPTILKTKIILSKIRGTGCLLATSLACHISSGFSFLNSGKKAKQFVFKFFKKR